MNKIDVVILAGAKAGPDLMPGAENTSRAMMDLGGKPMIQWVVDAIRGCEQVGRIAVVGEVTGSGIDVVVNPGPNLVSNIYLGVEALGVSGRVLVVCADVPLLTSEAVDDFVNRALKIEAVLAYPVIPRSQCEAKYPGLKRTYLRTADGVFTGGNLVMVDADFLRSNGVIIERAYAARKHVSKLARMIGVGILLRVVLGQIFPRLLTLSTLERAAGRLVNAPVAAIVSDYPEIGEDIDKPSDVESVRKILAAK